MGGGLTSGVPQGSVLGPLLFIIYINDLDSGISSDISEFADDSRIGRIIRSESDVKNLQGDLDRLNEWMVRWQMGGMGGRGRMYALMGYIISDFFLFQNYKREILNKHG